jgi:hypothetical protein
MGSINPRALEALAAVQRDLDAAGLAQYRMQLVLNGGTDGDGTPLVSAALPDGSFWSAQALDVQGAGLELVQRAVAELVQDTLAEVERVIFPTCADHQGRQAVPRVVASGSPVMWWCDGAQEHALARVGNLAAVVPET